MGLLDCERPRDVTSNTFGVVRYIKYARAPLANSKEGQLYLPYTAAKHGLYTSSLLPTPVQSCLHRSVSRIVAASDGVAAPVSWLTYEWSDSVERL